MASGPQRHGDGDPEREREVIARARANEELMRQMRESEAEALRGEPPIPGRQVQEEARARRGRDPA